MLILLFKKCKTPAIRCINWKKLFKMYFATPTFSFKNVLSKTFRYEAFPLTSWRAWSIVASLQKTEEGKRQEKQKKGRISRGSTSAPLKTRILSRFASIVKFSETVVLPTGRSSLLLPPHFFHFTICSSYPSSCQQPARCEHGRAIVARRAHIQTQTHTHTHTHIL